MSSAKVFECPSCGGALTVPANGAAQLTCPYCGNTVVVPPELRAPAAPIASRMGVVIEIPSAPPTPIEPSIQFDGSRIARWIVVFVVGIVVCILLTTLAPIVGMAWLTSNITSIFTAAVPSYAHVVMTFGGEGTGPGLFQKARHLAVDPGGNIYVSDANTLRIQKFDASGKYLSQWTIDDPTNSKQMPTALAADRAGHVFVLWNGTILKYDGAGGALLAKLGDQIFWAMATLADGGLIASVGGSPADDFVRFDAGGNVVARYAKLVSTPSGNPISFSQLHVAVDGLGTLFVLNSREGAVYKFTPEGKYVTKFGSLGKGAGQFSSFTNLIAVDNQSRVYANDSGGIEVFDTTGRYLGNINSLFYQGAMQDLKITDKNEIFVVDGNSKVYKLALNQ